MRYLIQFAKEHWGETYRFLCEDKNRHARPDEIEGVDLVYRTEKEIAKGESSPSSYLVTYEWTQIGHDEKGDEVIGRRQVAGLPIKRVIDAIKTGHPHFLVIPPEVCLYLNEVFPLMRSIFVATTREDRDYYWRMRGLPVPLNWPDNSSPVDVPGLQVIQNRRGQLAETAKCLERFLRQKPTYALSTGEFSYHEENDEEVDAPYSISFAA